MKAALTIAGASLLEHSRRKLIVFFAAFSILVAVALLFIIRDRGVEETFMISRRNFVLLVSQGVLGFFALLATLAVSMGNIGGPFASGEALPILARPISRSQYALGRFLASAAVITGLCALIALELQIIQVVAGTSDPAPLWAHWGATAFNLTVVAAITTLLSVFISTPIIVAVIGYFTYQALGVIEFVRALAEAEMFRGPIARAVVAAWHLTPKFLSSPFERATLMGGGEVPAGLFRDNTPGLVLWAVAYLAGLVAVTLLFVERKEV